MLNNFRPVVRYYSDSRLINEQIVSNIDKWQAHINTETGSDAVDIKATFSLVDGSVQDCALGLKFEFPVWSTSNYVCMPAAVYAGNRFESRCEPYPPLLRNPEDWKVDSPIIITDVPRLNVNEGNSRIQLISRDLATPALGIFFPESKKGLWILTDQGTRLGDYGFDLKESDDRTSATFTLLAPGMREGLYYRGMQLQSPSKDKGADFETGDEVSVRCRVYQFDCKDISALFDRFVSLRKDFVDNPQIKQELPFSAAWRILEEKYNRDNWAENYGYYTVGVGEGMANHWQLGWVGGGIVTQPMISEGSDISRGRALRNLGFMLERIASPSGFLYGIGDGESFYGDGFSEPHPHNMHMTRKSSDALYFIIKQFFLLDAMGRHGDIRDEWIAAARNLADAFVGLWEKYGQFGQFVDIETGEIVVGGSTSASTAPAGLALASRYFDDPRYLDVATKSAEIFYSRDVLNGVTTGGPGEILQCPDSESAFGLLDSFVVLYEVTGDVAWIERAEDAANQCASWCVSYDFVFPPDSLFGKLDMKTTGSVWANVQNKHSAPGICTLSGDSLFRLYRATGNRLYMELLVDIAHGITQYLSRSDRPVGDMPSGWMNERVNMCDWEDNIGGIFYGSCWPEVSCMLTFAEVPGVYVETDSGQVWVFDNVEVSNVRKSASGLELTICNPTRFDAKVNVFAEDRCAKRRPLKPGGLFGCHEVLVAAGETATVNLSCRSVDDVEE